MHRKPTFPRLTQHSFYRSQHPSSLAKPVIARKTYHRSKHPLSLAIPITRRPDHATDVNAPSQTKHPASMIDIIASAPLIALLIAKSIAHWSSGSSPRPAHVKPNRATCASVSPLKKIECWQRYLEKTDALPVTCGDLLRRKFFVTTDIELSSGCNINSLAKNRC